MPTAAGGTDRQKRKQRAAALAAHIAAGTFVQKLKKAADPLPALPAPFRNSPGWKHTDLCHDLIVAERNRGRRHGRVVVTGIDHRTLVVDVPDGGSVTIGALANPKALTDNRSAACVSDLKTIPIR